MVATGFGHAHGRDSDPHGRDSDILGRDSDTHGSDSDPRLGRARTDPLLCMGLRVADSGSGAGPGAAAAAIPAGSVGLGFRIGICAVGPPILAPPLRSFRGALPEAEGAPGRSPGSRKRAPADRSGEGERESA